MTALPVIHFPTPTPAPGTPGSAGSYGPNSGGGGGASRAGGGSRGGGRPNATEWARLWVRIDLAATALGKSVGHLRRIAAKLAARGLATQAIDPEGRSGVAVWWIARRYDLALAPGQAGQANQAPDLAPYSRSQQATAWQRVRAVERLREARCSESSQMRQWLGPLVDQLKADLPGLKISGSTLLRWDGLYRSPADVVKLIDRRGGDQKSTGSPPAWSAFTAIYLDARQPTIRSCWSRIKDRASAEGWAWCSYRSCVSQLADRIPPETQCYHRDPRKWRSQYAPYIEQDPERFAAGECWVSDHRPLDLWARMPDGRIVRPVVTAWQDWRTRRIVGAILTDAPNSSTILAALRQGLVDPANGGGPSTVWLDNGKDFDCWALQGQTKHQRLSKVSGSLDEPQAAGLFKLLGIDVHFSIAFNPQGKARMERWFATVGSQFDKSFATYCGNQPMRRPEDLHKVMHDAPHKVPAFQHVLERFNDFTAGYNARSDHSIDDLVDHLPDGESQRLSPDEAMARWRTTRRVMADPGVLDLLLAQWHKPVRVGRNGLTITIAGRSLRYGRFDAGLMPYKGRPDKLVNVSYDPHDLRQVRVYDDQWRYITSAELNVTGGVHGAPITRQHVADLSAAKASRRKALRTIAATAGKLEPEYLTDAELIAQAANTRPVADQHQIEGRPLTVLRTALDGQAQQVARAESLRAAAGAESTAAGGFGHGLSALDALANMAAQTRGAAGGDDDDNDQRLTLADLMGCDDEGDDQDASPLTLLQTL